VQRVNNLEAAPWQRTWTWWLRGKEAVDAFYLEFIIKNMVHLSGLEIRYYDQFYLSILTISS
jgi:hypothetical protein